MDPSELNRMTNLEGDSGTEFNTYFQHRDKINVAGVMAEILKAAQITPSLECDTPDREGNLLEVLLAIVSCSTKSGNVFQIPCSKLVRRSVNDAKVF